MEYRTDNEWRTDLMLSERKYDHKPTQNECSRMKFTKASLTMDGLAAVISEGYSFCPTDRRKEAVGSSDMIVIDIDHSPVPMDEFVRNLTDIPSIYYTTPSNKEGNWRFRLVYALKEPTRGVNSYNLTSEYIINENSMYELNPTERGIDRLQANQMFNGSFGCDITVTGRVYSVPPALLAYTDVEEEDCGCNELSDTVRDAFLSHRRIGSFLAWFEDSMGIPGVLTETPYVPCDREGILVPDGRFMRVPMKYGWWDGVRKEKVYVKWNDGENRHGKLYLAGLIMRTLNPTLCHDELFYGYVDYIYRYIDLFNSDKSLKYTRERILSEFDAVITADLTGFRPKYEPRHRSFKVIEGFCEKNGMTKREVVNEVMSERYALEREERHRKIDEALRGIDVLNTTNKRCLLVLHDKGIDISNSTFKKYLSDRGIEKRKRSL